MERNYIAGNKKKAAEEGRVIVYADEASLNLLPSVHSTYSEIGNTPVLTSACKYTHLSMASGISEDGRMVYQTRQNSFNGPAIVLFLKELKRRIKQKLLVIWDGAKIHSCEVVKRFLQEQKDERIWLVKTPAYSPGLNADEQVWNYIKNVEMKNICCKTITELRIKASKALESLKNKKEMIRSFFKHPEVGFINN